MSIEQNNERMASYAKSAISGSVILNSGALIAVLSQLPNLSQLVSFSSIRCAMFSWTLGVCIGTVAWVFAFMSTASFGHGQQKPELIYTGLGLLSIILAIVAFGFGMYQVASGLDPVAMS